MTPEAQPDESARILPVRVTTEAEAAVVFIHGFSGKIQKTWGRFPEFLSAEPRLDDWDIYSVGYSTRLIPARIPFWTSDASIPRLATLLRTKLKLPPLDRYQSLAVVAHSMGGLVAQRAILDEDELRARIGHLILMGTPSDGLKKAKAGSWLKEQIEDMVQGGPFITALRAGWNDIVGSAPRFRFATVAGERDDFVEPWTSLDPFPRRFHESVPGSHRSMVKPGSVDSQSVKLVKACLGVGDAGVGPLSAARRSVQQRRFWQAIDRYTGLETKLDEKGLVEYALALAGVGRQEEAIAALKDNHKNRTDAMGTFAGQLKRHWEKSRIQAHAELANSLYRRGLEISETPPVDHGQAFYHAINAAYMSLFWVESRQDARRFAQTALEHCQAHEPDCLADKRLWLFATQGEAAIYLDRPDDALAYYAKARDEVTEAWQATTIHKQARTLAAAIGEPAPERIDEIFGLASGPSL